MGPLHGLLAEGQGPRLFSALSSPWLPDTEEELP